MSRHAQIKAFADRLGHAFRQPHLLEEALLHASFKSPVSRSNQRLEFLGDRVLGLVVAEALLKQDPDAPEGHLAPRLNALVRKETCAEIAAEIELGQVLQMGRSEMQSGGRRKLAILGDAMEAVIAAVYLDGGLSAAEAVIHRHWKHKFAQAPALASDPKTSLQEWAQARGMSPPTYTDLARRGPDHAPLFEVEVSLENGAFEKAEARSKRAAQQGAAEKLLQTIRASADE